MNSWSVHSTSHRREAFPLPERLNCRCQSVNLQQPVRLEKGSYSCFRSAYTHSWRGAGPEVGAALVSQSDRQLLDHSDGLFSRRYNVLAGVDRVEHAAISRTLVEGTC